MALAYTRRLVAHVHNEGTMGHLLYTQPGPGVVIVRDLVVANRGAVPVFVNVYIILTSGYAMTIYSHQALGAGAFAHLEVRQEILVAEQLRMSSDALDLSLLITGYQFS